MVCDMDKKGFFARGPFFRRGSTAPSTKPDHAESDRLPAAAAQKKQLDQATKKLISKYGAESCQASLLRCSNELGEAIHASATSANEQAGHAGENDLLIQSILDSSLEAILFLDESGAIVRSNDVALNMFAASTEGGDGTKELAKGTAFSALFDSAAGTHLQYLEMATTPAQVDKILDGIDENHSNSSPATCRGRNQDGIEFPMQLNLGLIQTKQENAKRRFVACCSKLPDKSDEEKLLTTEESEWAPKEPDDGLEHDAVLKVVESLLEDASDASILTNVHGFILGLNRAALELLGYGVDNESDLVGEDISTIFKDIGIESPLDTNESTPERRIVETTGKRMDGTEVSVLVGVRVIPTTSGSCFIVFDSRVLEENMAEADMSREPISSWEAVEDSSSSSGDDTAVDMEMDFTSGATTPVSVTNKLSASIRSLPLDIAEDIKSPVAKRANSLRMLVNDSQGGALFSQTYTVIKELGEGGFATVHQCEHKISKYKYAVKEIFHDNYMEDGEGANSIREEIAAMKALRESPFIVRLFDVFQEPSKTYIVCEEMEGGDLLDRITDKGRYSEADGRVVARSLLSAVRHMHVKGWAHRDIKPENILLLSTDDDCTIKLCDFGCAQPLTGDDCLTTMAGSPQYAAPEIYSRSLEQPGYGKECDLWSTGVVLYVMLGGYAPFDADNVYEMAKLVCDNDWEFHDEYWSEISEDTKSLISLLLTVDRHKRLTADQALDSKWLRRKRSKLFKSSSEKRLGARSGERGISRNTSFDNVSLDDFDLSKALESTRPQPPQRIIPMVWTGDGDDESGEKAKERDDDESDVKKSNGKTPSINRADSEQPGQNGLVAAPSLSDDSEGEGVSKGPENRKSFFGFLPTLQDSSDDDDNDAEERVFTASRTATTGGKVMYWKRTSVG